MVNATTHNKPRRAELPIGILLLTLGSASADPLSKNSVPTPFLGHASGNPPIWDDKPLESIEVGFCTRGYPPPLGSVVTVVPSDNSLPTVAAHVVGSERDEHDECTAVRLDPIKSQKWMRWRPPASSDGTWHQRVMVLAGSLPKARAIPSAKIDGRDLPAGTRKAKDLILAVDTDGDNRIDALGRNACKSGSRDCEEWRCEEVWVRGQEKWRMTEQICGD